jgi:hypothetical protein
MGAMPLGIVTGDPLLGMFAGRSRLSEDKA